MDRIEQDKLLEKILGKRQVWFDRTDVEKILNTLYSEPQVCPKPEQMMICPKAKECGEECFYPDHQIPHADNWGCTKPHNSNGCPACIPVPSTPASEHIGNVTEMIAQYGTNVAQATPASEMVCKCGHSLAEHYEGGGDVTYCEHSDCACKVFVPLPPDELLTDITKILDEIVSIARAGALMQHFKGKGVESKTTTQYAQDILIKCHQSEANIEEQLTEIVCSQYTRAEKAEAEIAELKTEIERLEGK